MKKIILSCCAFLLIIIIVLFIIFNNQSDNGNTNLKKVTIAEVAHSIFYAPQYVSDALGYFEDEGIDAEFILTPGADKVTAAVLSGDVQIGLCGSEATIYVYNQGEKDYLVNFSALTKRDGSFIVSRKKIKNFKLDDLKGKDVIGGRKGGMPEMTFEWALKSSNIDPKKDLNIDTSIEFASMAGAFIGGTGDFVTLFEPQASEVEAQGVGYVVASVGEYGGVVPYTAYNAKKSYIEENSDIIESYTKAIQNGLNYVHTHNEKDIAKLLVDYFPDTSLDSLTKIVKRYKDNDSWFTTTYIEENDFNHIKEIVKSAGELDKNAPYDKLVDNSFSKK